MSNTKFAIVLILLTALFVGSTLFMYNMNKEEYPNVLPVENMEDDSHTVVNEVTIDEVLQARVDILKCQYYDSVFLHMPETPLIAVLMKLGTEASNTEIAKEYLNNKKIYDNVQLGAQITNMRKKQFEPDSLPSKPRQDTAIINN